MAFSRLERLVEWRSEILLRRKSSWRWVLLAIGKTADVVSHRDDNVMTRLFMEEKTSDGASHRQEDDEGASSREGEDDDKGVFSGRRAEKTQERTRCDSSWCFRVRRVAERSSGRWRRISKERR